MNRSRKNTVPNTSLTGKDEKKQTLTKFFRTDHWRSIVALTLNLKQSIATGIGGFVKIDEQIAKKAFAHFMHVLNRRVYGAAYRHGRKRLRVIPVIEKSAGQRLHYHVALEPPDFMPEQEFAELSMQTWLETELGYGHGDIQTDGDGGWIDYMTKSKTKDFEDYFDCIDIAAYCNPPAGV
jgi:hypothetical protein